ncbi:MULTISPECIES: helix-turn-helix domain-containing protein [Prauserella salsuginis group]|uniref:Transcriptional regulator with XRE-family HTH domain n=2 Tax=Prauserella salsuginis group TaxID=2893672 RepID=A0A839XQQ3_9PSEU|nr:MULTISPECIES: XRE family transcriptional regulator [Prauserella salsuginis group]MBB3663804.1 transcriptional regulator with XRE-family HTH domain [Prauserella sediminis]MCR3722417.1 Transcriptional regulator, contains XRE-family HTH domain [Prauserella flava]MCR3736859.1 Transcriptional regulator, contains XRE-family HTH domain [Prauserella salsuginis]
MDDQPSVGAVLEQIAPRLRDAREKKDLSLAGLARATGISTSTLSRLESGQRKPSLELLLPITAALGVPLDEIVAAPRIADPRVPQQPTKKDGRVLIPLSRQQGEPRAYKMVIPSHDEDPHLRTHAGHEWLYVLRGQLRVRLAHQDFVMGAGEAAEFDCQIPHWFGAAGRGSVEVLSLFGKSGERIHLRTPMR